MLKPGANSKNWWLSSVAASRSTRPQPSWSLGIGKALSFTPSAFSSAMSAAELISVALISAALASWP